MRRLMSGFLGMQSNTMATQGRMTFRRVSSLLTVAGVVCLSPAFAKDPETDAKAAGKGAAVRTLSDTEPAAIPQCLEKLKLSAKQQDQVKEIVGEYDGSLQTVWTQFSARYMQTIEMESSLLAAIEDNLTEPQRQQIREQREKTAQHPQANDKQKQKGHKPDGAAEAEIANAGITLTSDQEAAADKLHEKYRSQLRSMHREIQALHARLVSLEASKLTALEKVLTKDQLAQLRLQRQTAPASTNVDISKNDRAKTE